MFDPRWIRDNAAAFDEGRRRRGLPALSSELIALDDARRAAIAAAQDIQERRNAASQKIGAAMKAKDQATAEALKAEVAELKSRLGALESEEAAAGRKLDEALAAISNQPAEDVPEGRDEHDNVVRREWGEKPRMDFAPKEHFAIGEGLGLMDFETAAKMSGARFVVTKGRWRGSSGRCRNSCSTCTAASTATPRSTAAARPRRGDVRHRAAAEVSRRPVFGDPRGQGGGRSRPLAHPHCRSVADQSRARGYPRRGSPTTALHSVHPVLPSPRRARRGATRAA